MTTQPLYRFQCDAPQCTAGAIAEKVTTTPDGWRTLTSTDHIPVPLPRSPWERSRRSNRLSYSERCRGNFRLHLCPNHHDAFNAHLPITEGMYTRPGKDPNATVSCSCGASFGWMTTLYRVASADMTGPAQYTEKAWWSHLPAELQWYASRDTDQTWVTGAALGAVKPELEQPGCPEYTQVRAELEAAQASYWTASDAVQRVRSECDAIDAEVHGQHDEDDDGMREAVRRIRAALDSPAAPACTCDGDGIRQIGCTTN